MNRLSSWTDTYRSRVVTAAVARSFGVQCEPLASLLGAPPSRPSLQSGATP